MVDCTRWCACSDACPPNLHAHVQVDLQAPLLRTLALGDAQYPGVSQLTSLKLACPSITEACWLGLPYLAHLELACGRLTRLHLGSCNVLPDSALQGLGDPLPPATGCPELRSAARVCPVAAPGRAGLHTACAPGTGLRPTRGACAPRCPWRPVKQPPDCAGRCTWRHVRACGMHVWWPASSPSCP